MANRSPARSVFAVIFSILFSILWYVANQIFGSVLTHKATAWIAQMTGLPADIFGKVVGAYIMPAFVAGASLWAAFEVARWYLQQTEFADDPNSSALSLPAMSVTEIAEYLRDKSDWGWRRYAELNFWEFVKDGVPEEMRRAGKNGRVRYIGTAPNSANALVIDRSYWQHAFIDHDRIWDSRNKFFTKVATPGSDIFSSLWNYQYGMAPRVDILRTWPRASLLRRVRSKIWVRLKKLYYWLTAILRLS